MRKPINNSMIISSIIYNACNIYLIVWLLIALRLTTGNEAIVEFRHHNRLYNNLDNFVFV